MNNNHKNADFSNKGFRLIDMHSRLNKGELLYKTKLAEEYGLSEKSIQRDIEDLRIYFSQSNTIDEEVLINYDKEKKGYYLEKLEREWLTNEEILAISKILLESRGFCKKELDQIIGKILMQATPVDRTSISKIIKNEQFYYMPLTHNVELSPKIWELSKFIRNSEVISITYKRQDLTEKVHKIKPVSIMFSEFYFYIIAFMANSEKNSPTVFRIDRISDFAGTGEKFFTPYREKFDDGEFRKRILFMYGGELKTVRFEYTGLIEVVLDKLPTAKIIKENNGVYEVSAEVYGDGIYIWLKSQGDKVNIL